MSRKSGVVLAAAFGLVVGTTAQAHPNIPVRECWVTGGGFVGSQEITFGFNALPGQGSPMNPSVDGQHITIVDHDPEQDGYFCDNVRLLGCDCTAVGGIAVFRGDLRELGGADTGFDCEVTVIDNGEGASANADRIWFTSTGTGPDLIPVLTDLEGGNVQIHPTHCD